MDKFLLADFIKGLVETSESYDCSNMWKITNDDCDLSAEFTIRINNKIYTVSVK